MNRKKIFLFLLLFLLLLFIAYIIFRISKSRTYQFFGEIIPRVETEEKVVALTFDDGPTHHTAEVLEILAGKNIKTTFFILGRELERQEHIGAEILRQGHELGNHSYSHPRFWFKSPSFIAGEIEKTDAIIKKVGYKGEVTFRPPYGKKLFLLPLYLQQHDRKTIMWDVEPDSYGTEKDFLVDYTIQHTKPGSIIILHPHCDSCTGQRAALPEIIDGLHEKGFTFVTISELLPYRR